MPIIKFINKDSVYDFGSIQTGGACENPEYLFEIKNTGNAPLIITNIKSENHNLVFTWFHKAVKPGKKSSILVTYRVNAPAKTGSFNNDVLISSNATQQPYPFIHLRGTFIPRKGAPISPRLHDDFPTEPGYVRYNGEPPVTCCQAIME